VRLDFAETNWMVTAPALLAVRERLGDRLVLPAGGGEEFEAGQHLGAVVRT